MTTDPHPSPVEIAARLEETAKELRDNADCLKSWFDSVVKNQKEASFYGGYGVEMAAKDALDCAFRLAASVVDGLNKTSDAMLAVRAELEREGGE